MDYSEAMSYVFRDENWLKKVLIGGTIAFVSWYSGILFFLGFILVGYYLNIIGNTARKEDKILPEWDNFSKICADGLLGSIIILVYFVIIGGILALVIVNVAMDAFASGGQKAVVISLVSLTALCAMTMFSNLGLLRFAQTGDFAEAFKINTILAFLRQHLGDLIAITIFSLILNLILLVAGLGIFSPFTNFWGFIVQAHLFGQCLAAEYSESGVLQSAELNT